ncbi:MAG: hypothetical protein ABII90_11705 [Bacteroidota bacterium]
MKRIFFFNIFCIGISMSASWRIYIEIHLFVFNNQLLVTGFWFFFVRIYNSNHYKQPATHNKLTIQHLISNIHYPVYLPKRSVGMATSSQQPATASFFIFLFAF